MRTSSACGGQVSDNPNQEPSLATGSFAETYLFTSAGHTVPSLLVPLRSGLSIACAPTLRHWRRRHALGVSPYQRLKACVNELCSA